MERNSHRRSEHTVCLELELRCFRKKPWNFQFPAITCIITSLGLCKHDDTVIACTVVLILPVVYECNLFKSQITLVDNDMLLWRLRTQVVLTFCSLICTVFGFF